MAEAKTEENKTSQVEIELSVKPPKDDKEPRSILAGKGHRESDLLQSKCFNHFYDGLTIFISIADVTTDVMVLLSYYYLKRMTFFWISLVILLLAQFGYVMVFVFTFEIDDLTDKMEQFLMFICCKFECCVRTVQCCRERRCCCWRMLSYCDKRIDNNQCWFAIFICFFMIIFSIMGSIGLAVSMSLGHLVAFLMYFAEDEESKVCQILNRYFGIVKRTRIPLEDHLSEETKFAIKKINRHGGFILEAFMEALPQSILQLVAMVYYQETNIVSIGSILLSMTSIMTKSFVISQGIEWKSYLFCWLCVITDFFSIFFIVSWVFLSSEDIGGDFLGYFRYVQ